MPLTLANATGLALVLVILVEGGTYWWLKLDQLSTRRLRRSHLARDLRMMH